MKKIILKVIIVFIIIVLIILTILGINLTRKHYIIKDLEEKLAKYKDSQNYYIEMNPTDKQDTKYYYYKLNNIEVEKMEAINVAGKKLSSEDYRIIGSGKRNLYLVTQNYEKIAILNNEIEENDFSNKFFEDVFKTKDSFDYVKFLLNVKISEKEYNKKKCYCVNIDNCLDFLQDNVGGFLLEEGESISDYTFDFYIEKETGLIIYNPFQFGEYEYKFNVVTEDDVKEPDISDYDVQEN